MKYKGLKGSSWSTKKQLFHIAEKSVYYWWWQFLRLTPEFWYANQTRNPIQNPDIRRVYELIGGLPSHSFKAWWDHFGVTVFAETGTDRSIKVVNKNELEETIDKDIAYFAVPLSLNKQEIKSQFTQLLNTIHRGRNYDVEAHSNAQLKLFNHKYSLLSIERQFWVLLYKLIYPKTPLWVIGDRLRLAPHLNVRHIDRKTVERQQEAMFLQLQSHTWRYHAHALNLLDNLKIGSFPNYKKFEISESSSYPFGTKLENEFVAATEAAFMANSPWQRWIKRHYQEKLHEKIYLINEFDKSYKEDSHFVKHFKKFVNGKLEM